MQKLYIFILLFNIYNFSNSSSICGFNGNIRECIDQINMDHDRNFITSELKKYSKEQKLKYINQLVPLYSRQDIKIQDAGDKGFGVFINQNISVTLPTFQINLRKTISSFQINQRMFLQSSLTLQHKQTSLNKRNFRKVAFDKNIDLTFSFMKNLFYHYGRLKDSFLKEEIIAYPLDYLPVYFSMNDDEMSLLKNNLQKYKDYIIILKSKLVFYYHLFIKTIKMFISDEYFTFYFGIDGISMQEYQYLSFIDITRAHGLYGNIILIPIGNFINQITKIEDDDKYGIYTFNYSNKLQIIIKKISINQELLIDYGYKTAFHYGFNSGFVPDIPKLFCLDYDAISEAQASKFNLQQIKCIYQQNFEQYFLVLFLELDQQQCNTLIKIKQKIALKKQMNNLDMIQNRLNLHLKNMFLYGNIVDNKINQNK